MNQFKVTFKRVEAFYESKIVNAPSAEKAQEIADKLSFEGCIAFDYLAESDLIDEHICSVEKM
jgi:hypothetical protein